MNNFINILKYIPLIFILLQTTLSSNIKSIGLRNSNGDEHNRAAVLLNVEGFEDLIITQFEIKCGSGSNGGFPIKIYYTNDNINGESVTTDQNAWTKAYDGTIQCNSHTFRNTPEISPGIPVYKNEVRGIIIYMPNRRIRLKKNGGRTKQNSDIQTVVYGGVNRASTENILFGVGYETDKIFLGSIYYKLVTLSPTLNPTQEPTLNPTQEPTLNPTLHPSLTPSLNPSSSPTPQYIHRQGERCTNYQSNFHHPTNAKTLTECLNACKKQEIIGNRKCVAVEFYDISDTSDTRRLTDDGFTKQCNFCWGHHGEWEGSVYELVNPAGKQQE